MFNQYPYINLNDLNLDYILKAIKEMRYEVTNFVSINAIKYADPIQWNITSQYEKNTIVIDPQTGTAYISVAPVPAGVALTRPEYWTVVFDLGSFVTRAAQNFTSRWESDTTLTATFSTPAGGWLVWGDVLYKALVNITAGDAYVVDSNIEHFTMEDLYLSIIQAIANEVQARQDADDAINATIGDLDDLTTSDKSSVVNAINDEVQARQDADDAINTTIGDLDDLTTSDKSSVVSAINENVQGIANEVQAREDADGDLNDLNTTDKSNLVNAINEVLQAAGTKLNVWDVKEHGAEGDAVTDDTQAFKDAIASGMLVFVPKGMYRITETLSIPSFTKLIGEGQYNLNKARGDAGSVLLFDIPATDNGLDLVQGAQYVHLSGLTVTRNDNATPSGIGINVPANTMIKIDNCEVYDFYTGFNLGNVGLSWISDCYAHDNYGIGFQYKNIAISGALQWQTQRCFAQENNASGFAIIGVANAANHVTLGMFEQCYTYNNGGYGFYVQGAANAGINGLRLSNCFFGNDNQGGIRVNSLGTFGGFIADTVVEACGRSASGRGQSIPVNTAAMGMYFIETGGNWTVSNCIIKQCQSYGIQSRSDFLKVVNCDIESNGVGIASPVNVYQTIGLIAILDCYIANAAYADVVLTTDAKHLISNVYLMSATPWRALAGTTNITFNNNITA